MPDAAAPGRLPDGVSYAFDRVADEYEATRYLPPETAEAFARHVTRGLAPNARLLDAGVGTGRIGRALARARPGRVIGVDLSRPMLARMRAPEIAQEGRPDLALADLRALPFADGTFGAVVAVHVFHLIPDWAEAVAETWRVVRPGGVLILGREERDRSRLLEAYLSEADRRGVLPPNPGGTTAQVLGRLTRAGAAITEARPGALTWEQRVGVRETLSMLERRTFSVLWSLDESDHRDLLDHARRRAEAELGTLDASETLRAGFVLYTARKPD